MIKNKVKVLELEKEGVVYSLCKSCNPALEIFRSTIPNHKSENGEMIHSMTKGVIISTLKGFKVKRFTII